MKNIKSIFLIISALLLAACGGGGGDAGGTTSNPGAIAATPIVVKVSIVGSTNTASQGAPITIKALVTTDKGVGLSGLLVTFTTKLGQGAFFPASGTALTDASGTATINLLPKDPSSSGADEVVATVSAGTVTASGSIGFNLIATNVTISNIKIDTTSIASYGQTGVTVNLAGVAQGTPVSISLTSNCGTKMVISPSQVTTTVGSATFAAADQGCGAERPTVTFTATVIGTAVTQTAQASVAAPTASSLRFLTAAPEAIFLKGSGYLEVAFVTFQVVDQGGNPLPNEAVKLDLTTRVGGLTLNDSAVEVAVRSDSDGKVVGRINAGTVPTPVRVRATLGNTGTATVSSNLTVGVGLPSQRNFSLSQGTFNIEGANYDGVPNTYTIFAADRSGNPVPTGTVINFVTEGGQIQSSRQTTLVNGIATTTAQFVSQSPRPADARVTITAYAVGEESFVDANGNNVWDAGESFQDLGDVYKDANYSGTFTAGEEIFPFGKVANCSVTTNPLLGYGDGIGANVANTCDNTWGRAFVRRSTETVFSSSFSRPVWQKFEPTVRVGGAPLTIAIDGLGNTDSFLLMNGSLLGAEILNQTQLTACQAAFEAILAPSLPAEIPVANGTAILNYTPGTGTCPASTVTKPDASIPPVQIPDTTQQAANNAQNLLNRSAIAFALSTRTCKAVKTGNATFLLSDDNPIRFNPMPAGTKITVKTTDGLTVDLISDSVFSTPQVTAHGFNWKFSDQSSSGLATFSFTTPRGNVSAVSVGISTPASPFIPTAPAVACLP